MNSEKTLIKVIQGLEKNKGLSVWIYDDVDKIPKRCKDWSTTSRDGYVEYHGPCAKDFWDWLLNNPEVQEWETIVRDKRVKLTKQEVLNRIQMKVITTGVEELKKSITPIPFIPPPDGPLKFFKPEENNAPPF
jgi:hypothetical protein